ncbi:uncharacterized protein LOC131300345 [Rhododendron vialii]|uniref:uncharacterized protein LOC131300345 n=1 Tax=Rhododendron vialii TaxID=182163 RepID=UPI00265D8680|nr:uncharacterized protein LOC131300345 [Rhododendron vialii]
MHISEWFGDAEKLTKALFSFASKLAPVIIFVDEVDSLLGARGGAFEHEATRRMCNEFMAARDGLRTKDSQRILILGATNWPFDLDDVVIHRLPRRSFFSAISFSLINVPRPHFREAFGMECSSICLSMRGRYWVIVIFDLSFVINLIFPFTICVLIYSLVFTEIISSVPNKPPKGRHFINQLQSVLF